MKAPSQSFSTPIRRSSSARPAKRGPEWTRAAVLSELKKLADPKVRRKLSYFGVNVREAHGISAPVLHKLARLTQIRADL